MSRADDPTTYWVCVDCYVTHHYGEPSEDPDYRPDREPLCLISEGYDVTDGIMWYDHHEDCPNHINRSLLVGPSNLYPYHECECETRTFSWNSCDGCGSTLGGSRHGLVVWFESEVTA